MQIGHIAIWTNQLEVLKQFYITYFNGISGEKYTNPAKGFESYFIFFEGGTSLELMSRKDITTPGSESERLGICHFAFDLDSEVQVRTLTERFRADGYSIAGEPRTTGDGFFESVILDPDGNKVELVYKKQS